MDEKKEIANTILSMAGRYAPYNIFSDWIQLCALSIQNSCCVIHGKIWQEREQLYTDTARKYTKSEMEQFARMFVLMGDALTEDMTDL